jgi:hypothetical protein
MSNIVRAETNWITRTRSIFYEDGTSEVTTISQEEVDEVLAQNQAVYDAADAKQQAIETLLNPVSTDATTEELAQQVESQRILILNLIGETG